MSQPASNISVTAFLAGIATHWGFFHWGERYVYPVRYLKAFLLALFVAVVAQSHYTNVPVRIAVSNTVPLAGTFLLGLYSSLITWRLFFNPLNKFPGPFFARISKFDHVFRNLKNDNHHQLRKRHEQYGRFLRLGPNDLSVTDPDAVELISGPKSKCIKSPWYDQDTPILSMHTTRDREQHDRRRRIWISGFSDKAIRGYEKRFKPYNQQLLAALDENQGKPMNMSLWFNLYTFDAMGDLSFGRGFDMIKQGKPHWAIDLLNEGMAPLGWGLPTWFFRVLVAIPGATAGYIKFINYCSQQLDDRMKLQDQQEHQDLIHPLIEHYNKTDAQAKKTLLPKLQADSRLLIVAGSDTTAAALSHLFYWLAKRPDVAKKLRKELSGVLGDDPNFEHRQIQDCEYLNGCMDEALRLNPPVPSGIFRQTPKEGLTIGNTFIPGRTNIQVPTYVTGHDEFCFEKCEEFIPERWFSKPEMVKHKDGFGAFSHGPFGCIGKNIAYMEIRMLTAQIIMLYDVGFAPGEDGSKLLNESHDHFTMGLAPLNLVFTKRK